MTKRNIIILAGLGALVMAATHAEEPPPIRTSTPEVSRKAPLPFNKLTDVEQDFYRKSFDYALDTLGDDQTYEWRTSTAYGAITATRRYISKSKSTCRNFTETYTFGKNSGHMEGVGCKRQGKDGWCKLRETDMLSCAFEPPETIFDMIEMKAGKAAEITSNKANQTEWTIQKWWPF